MQNNTAHKTTDLEPGISNESLGTKAPERLHTPCRINVHSRRHRLADSDGICAKYVIDSLIYHPIRNPQGILPDDRPEFVEKVSFSQEKIGQGEIEETVITII